MMLRMAFPPVSRGQPLALPALRNRRRPIRRNGLIRSSLSITRSKLRSRPGVIAFLSPSNSGRFILFRMTKTAPRRTSSPTFPRRFTAGEDAQIMGRPMPCMGSRSSAFSPVGYVYICYTLQYTAPPGPPISYRDQYRDAGLPIHCHRHRYPRIDPASELVLLAWYAGGHNGGCVKFGPDGYLYVSSGDGGDPDPPDPFNTGQDISDLLCSILRIDVDHPRTESRTRSRQTTRSFILPARDPKSTHMASKPWRMNFDRGTGNLWVGDVGWELWESIQCVKPGGNYGWSIMEGPTPFTPTANAADAHYAACHCSFPFRSRFLTGGIVYHGSKLPELKGQYIFGDWQTTRLWAAP